MLTASEIETIVRVVVARLRGLQSAQVPTPAPEGVLAHVIEQSSPQTNLVAHISKPNDPQTLSLDSRLVTLEHLRGRLQDIAVLEVAKRAIVTPAVIDALKDRGIRLQRREPTATMPATEVSKRMLVVTSQTAGNANVGSEQVEFQAIGKHLIDPRHVAVWSSKRPYAAAIAAQGSSQVRALQLPNPTEFERAMVEANPNLIIVDELHWTPAAVTLLAKNWSQRSQ